MLEVIIRILGVGFASVMGMLIIKNLLNEKFEMNIKNVILLFILSIITSIQFQTTYSIDITLITYVTIFFIYKLIFNIDYRKSLLASGVMLAIILIVDMFWSLIILVCFSIKDIRGNIYYFTLTNILIYTNAWLISNIPIIRRNLNRFINKVGRSKIYSQILFIILTIILLCLIGYNLVSTTMRDRSQYPNVVFIFVLILILLIIYLKSKNDNDRLQQRFNNLYDYSQNYEEWIAKEQLAMHENKNQLIVIRNMVKQNSKAVDYINEIINEDYGLEDKWLGQLINIPSGGLKGLLYYKLITIEKHKLNFCVDISQNAKSKLKKIQKEQLKDISHIIGIYLDNAIEASIKSNKKMLALEIYCIKNELNVVITNSFNEDVDMVKLNDKGYTTKGKGRGNGLYFVTKIKEKNNNIDTKTNIINDYFVQRIVVN